MPDRSVQTMEITVPLVKLVVSTYYSGRDIQPGVHIHVDATPENSPTLYSGEDGVAFCRFPMGLIPRDQVRKLRDLLTEFLLDFPQEEA